MIEEKKAPLIMLILGIATIGLPYVIGAIEILAGLYFLIKPERLDSNSYNASFQKKEETK